MSIAEPVPSEVAGPEAIREPRSAETAPRLLRSVRHEPSPVIVAEFNELSPVLMRRFIDAGLLPNFRRLHDEALVFTSQAEERAPYLDPWIQWITVHTGLNFRDHGIRDLDDGQRLETPCVWDLLSREGRRVWVCGSMNARWDAGLLGSALPDPWSSGLAPVPRTLATFHDYVRTSVLEHSAERAPLGLEDHGRFLAFLARHGLSAATARGVARQLLREGLRGGSERWRRATLLDRFQLDLFEHVYWRERPHLSTFFSNSTAHFQHLYWRNMEPELFRVKPGREEQARFARAIQYGYEQMDEMAGRLLRLAGDDATLVLCTALSQQPCLAYEERGGKANYRPRGFDALFAGANVPAPQSVAPVMSEQFRAFFASAEEARRAEERLAALCLEPGGPALLGVERQGTALFLWCREHGEVRKDAVVRHPDGTSFRFFDAFYRIEGLKSGMHHPDGILWIRRPSREHRVHPGVVPLDSVAPTLLEMLGARPPEWMRGEPLPVGVPRRRAA